jgi:uncharacterized membrane protein YphA (DoxX/SURF4 family)
MAWVTHPTTAVVARIILGCTFLYASLDKIRHPDLFAEVIYNYQLLPDVAVNLVAIWLPWLELLSGGLLMLGIWVRGSVLVIVTLMVLFFGTLGFTVARGLDIHCGCFTIQSTDPVTVLTLFRDSVLLCIAVYLFWLYQFRRVQERFSVIKLLPH